MANKRFFRGQVGIETMIMYGVVILVAGGAIVLIANTGVLTPKFCSKQKYGFSGVYPADWAVYRATNNVVLSLFNNAGYDVNVTGVTVTIEGVVVCSAETNKQLAPTEGFVIVVPCTPDRGIADKLVIGACYNADTVVNYTYHDTAKKSDSKGRFTGPIEEGAVTTFAITTTTTTTTTLAASTTTTTTTTEPTTTTTTTSTTEPGVTTTTTTSTTLEPYEPPGVELISPGDGTQV